MKKRFFAVFCAAAVLACVAGSTQASAGENASDEQRLNDTVKLGGIATAGFSLWTAYAGSVVQDLTGKDIDKRNAQPKVNIPETERAIARKAYIEGELKRLAGEEKKLGSLSRSERIYQGNLLYQATSAWIRELGAVELKLRGVDLEAAKKAAAELASAEKMHATASKFTKGGLIGAAVGGGIYYVGDAGVSETLEKAKQVLSGDELAPVKQYYKEIHGDRLN